MVKYNDIDHGKWRHCSWPMSNDHELGLLPFFPVSCHTGPRILLRKMQYIISKEVAWWYGITLKKVWAKKQYFYQSRRGADNKTTEVTICLENKFTIRQNLVLTKCNVINGGLVFCLVSYLYYINVCVRFLYYVNLTQLGLHFWCV